MHTDAQDCCTDKPCIPGCRLKKALGDLGLTIKNQRVRFFHCENATAGADISGHQQLHEEEFCEIVSTVFHHLDNEHLSPTKDKKGEHTLEDKRWKGQSKLVFDRYAGAKVLTHQSFLSALAALGLSLPQGEEEHLVKKGEEIDCEQFQQVVHYMVLHHDLRRLFDGLPQSLDSNNMPAMPTWIADRTAISSFPRVFQYLTKSTDEADSSNNSSEEVKAMNFASYRAMVAMCMLKRQSSWDELLYEYLDPTGDERGLTSSETEPGDQGSHCLPLAHAQQEIMEILSAGEGDREASFHHPDLAPVHQRLIAHAVAPGVSQLAQHHEVNDAVVKHLETLSPKALVALIPWLHVLRRIICARAGYRGDGGEASELADQLHRLGWSTVLLHESVQGHKLVIKSGQLQDGTRMRELLSAAGLKLSETDLQTLKQHQVLAGKVKLQDLCNALDKCEEYLEARHNLQHWIQESLDLNTLASSLAASKLPGEMKGSQWQGCFEQITTEQDVETWLTDVARKAAPTLWRRVKEIKDDFDRAQAQEAAPQSMGGDKFSMMPTAIFGSNGMPRPPPSTRTLPPGI